MHINPCALWPKNYAGADMHPEASCYGGNGYYGRSGKTLKTQISENIPLCVCHPVCLYIHLFHSVHAAPWLSLSLNCIIS